MFKSDSITEKGSTTLKNFRRVLASAVAVSAVAGSLLSSTLLAPAAGAGTKASELAGNTPQATVKMEKKNIAQTPLWRESIAKNPDRVKEVWAHSPSMNRDVPFVVITPKDNSQPRPTYYLLNGGDGGEGRLTWLNKTDVVDFFMDKNVNVVIPMSGKFSYYTDWEQDNANLGGKQKWETFLTKELPGPMEKLLKASDKRAISGLSMTATTTLLYAEHNPGFYDAIGSFSGCAQTSEGIALQGVRMTLERGGATPEQMWGPLGTPIWRHNDALINAEKLRGTKMYISNASGLAGQWDLWSSPWIEGNSAAVGVNVVEGGVIEGVTNTCTHDLKAKLDSQNIPAEWNLRPVGTHSWGYWQDDLHNSWGSTIAPALGL